MITSKYDLKIIRISVFNTLNEYCKRRVFEAENGSVSSVYFVGRCFIEGTHQFPVDTKTGMDFLDVAVKMQNAEAMEYYGNLLIKGDVVTKNEHKAVQIFTEAIKTYNCCEARVQLAKIILSHQSFDINSIDNTNVNYVLAKKYCKEAIMFGSTEGMVIYGRLCMKEKKNRFGEIHSDFKEALRLFQSAAVRGNYEGMAEYGLFLEFGYGVTNPCLYEATRYYARLHEKGDMTGYALYGLALTKGVGGLKKDEKKGLELIKESLEKKNPYGIYAYSQCLLKGLEELPKNEYIAIDYVKKAAGLGVREAIYCLGMCLKDGIGLPKNPVEAMRYFKLALEEGCSYAASQIGNLQVKSRKLNEGNISYQYGADHGSPKSIYQYCKNMLNNKGVEMNAGRLKKYLLDGVRLDDADCMMLYADLLLDGTVLAQNDYEAGRVLKRAADTGNKLALIRYAELLETGRGVIKNTKKAYELREKASKIVKC